MPKLETATMEPTLEGTTMEDLEREAIRRSRELLRPTPVKTRHVPTWLKRRLRQAVRELLRRKIADMTHDPYLNISSIFLLDFEANLDVATTLDVA